MLRFDVNCHADPAELRRLDKIIQLLHDILKAVQPPPTPPDAVRAVLTAGKPTKQPGA